MIASYVNTLPWFFRYLTDGHVDSPWQWMNWPHPCNSLDLWWLLWKYLMSTVVKIPVRSKCSFSNNVQKTPLIPCRKPRNDGCPQKWVWIHNNIAACQYLDSSIMQPTKNTLCWHASPKMLKRSSRTPPFRNKWEGSCLYTMFSLRCPISVSFPPVILHWNERMTPVMGAQGVSSHAYRQGCTTALCCRWGSPTLPVAGKRTQKRCSGTSDM